MAAANNKSVKKKTTSKESVKKASAGNKKTQNRTASKAAATRKARAMEQARQKQLRSEIILLILLAFSVFLLIANFRICGVVGNVVSGFFFGIIGFCEYIFPVYLFVSAAYLISNDFSRKIIKKVIYFGVVMILLSMLFQAIYSSDFESVKALYMDGYTSHAGGGVICGGIFFGIRTLLGVPGACIVMLIVAVIMFVLITEISVLDEIKKLCASINDRRKETYYEDDDEDGEYEHNDDDIRKRKQKKKQIHKEKRERDDRRVRPSMANLNVYADDRRNVSERKTLPVSEKADENRPKDFFANEDVHELMYMNDQGENGEYDTYENFHNDVEKIVMADSEEYINPVQIDTAPVKSRKSEIAATESMTTVNSSFDDQHATENDMVHDDINLPEEDDVLAGAINGNMHPESVSDYNPLHDSAFAQEAVPADNGIKAQSRTSAKASNTTDVDNSKTYKEGRKYKFPTANLLNMPPKNNNSNRDAYVRETAIKLKNTLETFGVNVTITNYSCGPAVTRFEMQPEQGVKVSKILNLADDIKLNLAAADIRIEAPIPGKAAIGIEVPNKENSIVAFRELIESDNFKNLKSKVAFAVGKDISGQVIATDIAKMPHLLIAGATGSGKSVCINTLIMSILYKATPEEVKLIMIDPKMVELACYNGIPHLLIPVVTDPKKAAGALNWAVMEMTRRYQLFAEHSVRNIQGYNDKVENAVIAGADGEKLAKMPQIVVIVDELADLMMVAHGEVEDAIVRLSQLARAAGIHLVIATQRPSVDVITGLIKANVPSRIAFAVSSGVDSRTILDMVGAEKLLGKGDMLFYPTGYPKPVRVQGAFVSDDEVTAVVDFLKKSNGIGTYDDDVAKSISSSGGSGATAIGGASASDKDEYFVEAGRFIIEKEKASIGMLQRTFKIGFNRAARIMDQLMAAGVVGPEEGTKARKILMTQEQFDEYIDTNL